MGEVQVDLNELAVLGEEILEIQISWPIAE